jgi:hypothetical protein
MPNRRTGKWRFLARENLGNGRNLKVVCFNERLGKDRKRISQKASSQ